MLCKPGVHDRPLEVIDRIVPSPVATQYLSVLLDINFIQVLVGHVAQSEQRQIK